MNQVAVIVLSALVLVELIGEYSVMALTGTLRRTHKREWTYYTMALPFKGMVVASLLEGILSGEPPMLVMVISGTLVTVIGILIRVRGHFALKGAFSPYVETTEDQTLVRSGMYTRIRHPMYLGSIFLFLGMPLTVAATWAWVFSVLGMAGIIIRIRKEESFLKSTLPGYDEYAKNTWRMFPYVY